MYLPLFCRACRAQARQKRLEPDPVAGILRGGRVLDGKRHELGSVVGGGTQGVALQQRANEHRTVQVAGAGKAAADVQLFDEEAVFSAACTADVFAQRQAGDDSPGGQSGQLVSQSLCGFIGEQLGLRLAPMTGSTIFLAAGQRAKAFSASAT